MERLGIGQTTQRAAIRQAAEVLRTEWVKVLSQPGSGKVYEAGIGFITFGGHVIPVKKDRSGGIVRRRAPHQASKPGEAPAKDSGASANSVVVDDTDPDAVRTGSNRRTLLGLEYGINWPTSKVGGHPGGIQIAPRPHARRAFRQAKDNMTARMVKVLRDAE
jgi:hypothetical protein